MAQAERQAEEKKSSKRAAAKERRTGSRRLGGKMQLTLHHWTWLIGLTELLAANDGALRIGFTRDGGALALGVYLGDDYATEYIRPNEVFSDSVLEIASAWITDGHLRVAEKIVELGLDGWATKDDR